MAITANLLAGAYNGTDGSSFSTVSFSPASNRLVLFTITATRGASAGLPPQPTINNGNWVLVIGLNWDTGGATQAASWIFRSMSASPVSAARTIDFGGITCSSCAHSVVEFDGVETTGTDGSGAVVQSGASDADLVSTSLTVVLSALGSANNAVYGAFAHQANEATDPGGTPTATELHDVAGSSPAMGFETQWNLGPSQPSASASWTTSQFCGALALEIKASTGAVASTDVLSPQFFRGRGI